MTPKTAAVKRTALKAASRCIAACDASKVRQTAFARICGLGAAEMLVTDWRITDERRSWFKGAGLGGVYCRSRAKWDASREPSWWGQRK